MRAPVYRPRRGIGIGATMTPMIDIIFQIQIFFLCTMGVAIPESVLPARLPETDANVAAAPQKPADVEMLRLVLRGDDAHFKILMNDRELSGLDELSDRLGRLKSASADIIIIFDVGREVILARMIGAYDRCLAAGFTRINFAASGGT